MKEMEGFNGLILPVGVVGTNGIEIAKDACITLPSAIVPVTYYYGEKPIGVAGDFNFVKGVGVTATIQLDKDKRIVEGVARPTLELSTKDRYFFGGKEVIKKARIVDVSIISKERDVFRR